MNLWIKNTDGKRDAILTFTVLGFLVVIVKVLTAGITFFVNGEAVALGAVDASTIGAILTPTLGAYVARRYTDRKYDHMDNTLPRPVPEPVDPPSA